MLDSVEIKKRSVKGVVALLGRQYTLQAFALVANLLFGVFLLPEEYGAYFLVAAALTFLTYFSDIGLAAALIQKKDHLKPADLHTTFIIQQTLVLSLIGLTFLLFPLINSYYSLNRLETYLFFALLASFFLASLKTIPTILMERDLEFHKLIIPQIVEHFFFYGIAVILAWQGHGVSSFTYAVIVRGIVGLVTIYYLKPYLPRLQFDLGSAKSLTSFGAPFQANSLLAWVKDDFFIAFLGGIFSRTEMGYITWAQRWAKMPLNALVNSVLTVTFPVFARLQQDKVELKKAIDKAVFFISLTVFPAVVGLIVVSLPFFQNFPKFEKWLPTVPLIFYFGLAMLVGAISTVFTNTLNAIGQVKTTLVLMLMWLALTWGLTLLLIPSQGYLGVAIAFTLTSLSSIVTIPIIQKHIAINPIKEMLPALSASLVMGVFVSLITPLLDHSLAEVFLLIILGAIVYIGFILMFFKTKVISEIGSLKKFLVPNQHGLKR